MRHIHDSTRVPGTVVHAFEQAGLGKAPFRFLGYHESKYQAAPGAPIQPGSCCDYCGTAIMGVFRIGSSDGREFKVGCDCVEKTDDAGLRRVVNEAVRKIANAKRHAREDALIAAAKAKLADPQVRAELATKPHPLAWQATQGRTLLDWAEWMMRNSGAAGKTKVAKALGA